MTAARRLVLATRARRKGARWALRIIKECRKHGLPIAAGFALIEKESTFRNVWGGDPAPNGGTTGLQGKRVRRGRYLEYRNRRGSTGRGGMQGVGPAQLTWYAFQDRADRRGGCWVPRHNIGVGIELLADLFNTATGSRRRRLREAARRYNGSGPAAEAYALDFMKRWRRWRRVLFPNRR